jgi:uncharacterized Zn finger protein
VSIIQNAMPPYQMRCRDCGKEWNPKAVTRGKTKGQITDSSLDKSANDHFKACEGKHP